MVDTDVPGFAISAAWLNTPAEQLNVLTHLRFITAIIFVVGYIDFTGLEKQLINHRNRPLVCRCTIRRAFGA